MAERVTRDSWTKALQGQENKIGCIGRHRLCILLSGEIKETIHQGEVWRHRRRGHGTAKRKDVKKKKERKKKKREKLS